jgi:hypothetical protein
MCLRSVETKSQSFDMTGGTISLGLTQTAAAIPNLADGGNTVKFHPGARPSQRVESPLYVRFPATKREIEISLSIPLRGGGLNVGTRCGCILFHDPVNWLHYDNQA